MIFAFNYCFLSVFFSLMSDAMDVVWWCQISEYQIIEISENVCNLKKQEADWILKIDIVEQGDRLEVRIMPVFFSLLLILWLSASSLPYITSFWWIRLMVYNFEVLMMGTKFIFFTYFWKVFHLIFTYVQLVEQDSEGQCNSECKTIERACQDVSFPTYYVHLVLVMMHTSTEFMNA